MTTYTVYADNRVEAEWFIDLTPLLKDARREAIASRGANPPVIDDLVRYDRPDIILLRDGKAVLVLEKTREVPTGHNVGQRFARLVRAVEEAVPTVAFFPFDARKHGDYTSICNLNIRLLSAFKRMTNLHQVPVLAINWTADEHGELHDDGTENLRVAAVVHDLLTHGDHRVAPEITRQLAMMDAEYAQRLKRYPAYSKAPPSVSMMESSSVPLGGAKSQALGRGFNARRETLVYSMGMTPQSCRREDPYTGTQFIYDYIWCRDGRDVAEKHTNLVLRFPNISRKIWYQNNPNDASRKSCNWYLTANALWFTDGVDLLR